VSSIRVGIDIGGTFTDLVALDETTGVVSFSKAPTTPHDPVAGVARILTKAAVSLPATSLVIHGATVAINAILEGKGARTGLVTTEGFRDVLQIGRGDYPELYNHLARKPEPLVPRRLRLEVTERVNARGELVTPLDVEQARLVARRLREAEVEAVAVCFLHAYANPAHELQMARILHEEYLEALVSLSHHISREWREYERTSTTVINAYIQPIVERYLRMFDQHLHEQGFTGTLLIMQSNGGLLPAERTLQRPVTTIESGPTAGAIATGVVGNLLGLSQLISFDMGGTTAKTCLVQNGTPNVSAEYHVNGHVVRTPVIDIIEVSAGGGSIAWVDDGGSLRVGPKSAGADPGPVCYGRGGDAPTITDANVFLGRINPENFLGGEMPLDYSTAAQAIQRQVAQPLNLDVVAASAGILRLANVKMAHAIRAITVEQGLDPRDFTLVAYGGGGPLHAAALARELNIPKVLIPLHPAHFSAWGMLFADLRHDFIQTAPGRLDQSDLTSVNATLSAMTQEGRELLIRERVTPEQITISRSIDLRYVGQEHTVALSVEVERMTRDDASALRRRFDEAHRLAYGYDAPEVEVEMVNLRVTALGRIQPPRLAPVSPGSVQPPAEAAHGTRQVYFEDLPGFVECPIYRRDFLRAGNVIVGPALVEEAASVTVVYPGDRLVVNPYGVLEMQIATCARTPVPEAGS
jgi:N-methylhydantoinase A